MPVIHRHSPPAALLLTAALLVCLAAAVFVGAAPASAGPPVCPAAGPSGSADELLAMLAVQQAQLTAGDGAAGDYFGYSVAISGDTAVVGAPDDHIGANTDQGSAYVFVRNGTTWSQQQKLTAADGAGWDEFGGSVAIWSDTAVVGAAWDDVGANADQGSAYVFVRSGTTWSQQTQLTATGGAASDHFGCAVAIDGETAVVGAYYDNVGGGASQGSAYVFFRSGTVWSQQGQLVAADGGINDFFGYSVAIDGETTVVGAYIDTVGANTNQGSAYVFVRSGTTWSQQAKLIAADGAAHDEFGVSVAVSGDTAVVGAYYDDVGANADQGSAYVFARSGTTWSQQGQLIAADGGAGDWFGISVAVSGETAVVGAYLGDVGANADQGSAYVFARGGTTWSQQAKLTATDGAAYDAFGISVAISGETAVVGAWCDAVGANTAQGSAYVFVASEVATPGRPVARSPKGVISSRTPTLRWTAAAGATTYEVRIYKGSRLIRKKTGITKTSWKCTRRLPRGVRLTWKVLAWNMAGWGPWSNRPRFEVR